jgi:hypothetical protein
MVAIDFFTIPPIPKGHPYTFGFLFDSFTQGSLQVLVVYISLLEKRFIITPAIHFWYGLITVADTKNELLFFVSADLINRYKKYYFSYRLT